VSHLNKQQVEAYQRRTLSPLELLTVDDHIASCPECRLRLAAGVSLSGALAAWEEVGESAGRPPSKPVVSGRWPVRGAIVAGLAACGAALLLAGIAFWPGSRAVEPPVELVDGAERVGLSPRGDLVGLASLPWERRREIATALRTGRLDAPLEIAELQGTRATARGFPTDPSLTLLEPIATVVPHGRPAFRWTLLPDADSYEIKVVDPEFRVVAESGRLSGKDGKEWTPDRPLPAGGVYAWQIEARRGQETWMAPGLRSAEARFRVLSTDEAGELERAVQEARGSHLALGVLYAKAGLVDEAERELKRVVAANPRSIAARRLLESVRGWRYYLPQLASPTSTKAPQ
jgi:hypothetical protein